MYLQKDGTEPSQQNFLQTQDIERTINKPYGRIAWYLSIGFYVKSKKKKKGKSNQHVQGWRLHNLPRQPETEVQSPV